MKKNQAQNPGPEGESPQDLAAEGMDAAQPGTKSAVGKPGSGLKKAATPGADPAPGARKRPGTETATESMEATDERALAPDEPSTESVMTEMVEGLPSSKTGDVAREDTEEVFVILPEEGPGQFPVVETVVVENQPWEAGPTTTEVLKEVPSNVPLEDVALKRTNPLSLSKTDTEHLDRPETGGGEEQDDLSLEKEEAGVIDEIADIAADLNRDEPMDAGIDLPRKAMAKTEGMPRDRGAAGSRRIRFLALASSLAALVLVGIFFWPDLNAVYERYAGGGRTGPVAGGHHQVQALGSPHGGTGTQDPTQEAQAARTALRSRILLAMQVGLRAEAGKE